MNRTSTLASIGLRGLLSGAVAGAAFCAWIVSPAAQQSVTGFNSNAPVNYAADRIELQDRQQRVILSGNVEITQGDLRLTAARTTVAYTNNGSMQIQRIDATGGVVVTRPNQSARGDSAVYDFNRRIITMLGNVSLQRGADTLNGGRLVMDLNTGVSTVDGRASAAASAGAGGQSSGRVSGTFTVPQRSGN